MSKPTIIVDPDWRRMDELFSPSAQSALRERYDVIWGQDGSIPSDILERALPDAYAFISATPHVEAETLRRAPKLRAVIEVSGAFPETIDYQACFDAGVEVLSCAPGFRQSVAEMGLAMALAGGRGLVDEHEAFRKGEERWLADREDSDFSLFGANVGFVGFGQIAQEITRLTAPFSPKVRAFDPWLPEAVAGAFEVELCSLDEVMSQSRCLFITAAPSSENYHLIDRDQLGRMPQHALLVVLSRAHLVDFEALEAELASGRIRACIDVFPHEPVASDDRLRKQPNVVLSPHRAAAVAGGRHLIGDMILTDLESIRRGVSDRSLSPARHETIAALAGVGDAASVSEMALDR